ncbi:MAG: MauE/DoxX family redox-associated membrane protein [bacterium]
MKTLLKNDYIIAAIRIILGFILIVASIDKISDPNAFGVSIGYYRIFNSTIILLIATIIPWIELLCGMSLVFGVGVRGGSLMSCILLIVFTAAVISGIFRGLDISCGCFTHDPKVDKIGWAKVAENVGLILLSLAIFFSRVDRFSVDSLPNTSNIPIPDDIKYSTV